MDAKLEQALIETLTTDTPQVILSALDPQTLYTASMEVGNAHHTHREFNTTSLQTPLFPDLVRGLCLRLWDNQVQWGDGAPFSIFDATDFDEEVVAEICGNRVVKLALMQLIPLSRQADKRVSLLIDAYCTDGCTPSERRELGVSRALDGQDKLDLLIVLLREGFWPSRLRAMQEGTKTSFLPRLIMQIDCIEYVTHCSPLDVAQYTAALTYLIDSLGDCFTLWLNVSNDDPSLSQEVKRILGTRFVSRITHDLTVQRA